MIRLALVPIALHEPLGLDAGEEVVVQEAERAGLRGITEQGRLGDVIVAVDGKAVATVAELARELERIGVGNTATLAVLRGGERVQVNVGVQDIS